MPGSRRPPDIRPDARKSLRLMFRYEGSAVQLTQLTPLAKRPPASIPIEDAKPLERVSGAWVEIRDRAGRCLWRQILHDPFNTVIEGAGGGRFTNAYRDKPSGSLVLLVPDLPEGTSVALVSSPLERQRRHQPARDLAEFELRER